jgi:uncharacterized membrane protein required for colicin V production
MAIDIILVVVAVYGFYVGYSRGIIKTIFSVLSIAIGVLAALRFTPTVTTFLKQLFNQTSPLMFVAGIIATFLLTMALLRLVGKGFEGILETANINVINQVIGGVFMAAVLVFLYSSILWFVLKASFRNAEEITVESQTYPFLKEYPQTVYSFTGKLKPLVQDFWDYTLKVMDDVQGLTEKEESGTEIYNIEEKPYDARQE